MEDSTQSIFQGVNGDKSHEINEENVAKAAASALAAAAVKAKVRNMKSSNHFGSCHVSHCIRPFQLCLELALFSMMIIRPF